MRSKKGMLMVALLSGLILIVGSTVPSMVQAQSKEPVKIGCLSLFTTWGPASVKDLWGAELGIKYVNEVMEVSWAEGLSNWPLKMTRAFRQRVFRATEDW
jgi:hypothetical protein